MARPRKVESLLKYFRDYNRVYQTRRRAIDPAWRARRIEASAKWKNKKGNRKKHRTWSREHYVNKFVKAGMTRSEVMARIKSVSRIELLSKKFAEQAAGCRLRHQPKEIFGHPDFANKAKKVAVFINGCFWHQPCPNKCSNIPKTNVKFWENKFKENYTRQKKVLRELKRAGWYCIVIWEHQVAKKYRL